MFTRRLLIFVGACLLAGCAAVPVHLPTDGPADPHSAETPLPQKSQTLVMPDAVEGARHYDNGEAP